MDEFYVPNEREKVMPFCPYDTIHFYVCENCRHWDRSLMVETMAPDYFDAGRMVKVKVAPCKLKLPEFRHRIETTGFFFIRGDCHCYNHSLEFSNYAVKNVPGLREYLKEKYGKKATA